MPCRGMTPGAALVCILLLYPAATTAVRGAARRLSPRLASTFSRRNFLLLCRCQAAYIKRHPWLLVDIFPWLRHRSAPFSHTGHAAAHLCTPWRLCQLLNTPISPRTAMVSCHVHVLPPPPALVSNGLPITPHRDVVDAI